MFRYSLMRVLETQKLPLNTEFWSIQQLESVLIKYRFEKNTRFERDFTQEKFIQFNGLLHEYHERKDARNNVTIHKYCSDQKTGPSF